MFDLLGSALRGGDLIGRASTMSSRAIGGASRAIVMQKKSRPPDSTVAPSLQRARRKRKMTAVVHPKGAR